MIIHTRDGLIYIGKSIETLNYNKVRKHVFMCYNTVEKRSDKSEIKYKRTCAASNDCGPIYGSNLCVPRGILWV